MQVQIKSRGASDGSSMAVWVPFLLLFTTICLLMGFPGGSDSNDCLQCRRPGFHPWVMHNRTEVSLYTTLEHAKDFYQKVLQNIGGETLAALRTQEFVSLPHPHLLGGGTGSQTGECGRTVRERASVGNQANGGETETSLEAEGEQQHTGLPLPGTTATSLRGLKVTASLPGWALLEEPASFQQH